MGRNQGRGRRALGISALLAGAACSGVEPALPSSSQSNAGTGATGVYVHGDDGGCGSGGAQPAAGTSATGTAPPPLPSSFGAGGGGAAGVLPNAGGAAGSHDAPVAGGANAGGGGSDTAVPLPHALLFSEYVEGSSTYKALEITALESSSLDDCRVAVYYNGGSTPSSVPLEGTLATGEQLVLCSAALAAMIASCDRTASLTFNGDDAIVLECEGQVVDAIGQLGFDPGTAWGQGDTSLLDHTLRRSCSVSAGDIDAADVFEPADEWLGAAKDSFGELGSRTCTDTGSAGAAGASGQAT